MSVVASLTMCKYNESIDYVMIEFFHNARSAHVISNDDNFCEAFSDRAEISKVMENVCGDDKPCDLFHTLVKGTINKLDELLTDVLDDNIIARIGVVKADNTSKKSFYLRFGLCLKTLLKAQLIRTSSYITIMQVTVYQDSFL